MSISSSQIISFTNPPTATGGGSVATNTAYGTNALAANTTGTFSTAVGYEAGKANTNGYSITAVGARAGWVVNGATNFTAVGTDSGRTSTTAASASFFGANSGFSNTTGSYLVAMGDGALYSNTTATQNTAVGYQAGYSNTTGANLVALGYQAGYSSNANNNTFIGYYAGQGTTGTLNTFVGVNGVGYLVSSGTKNTIVGGYSGNQSGLDIRTASNYIVLSDGDGNPRMYCNSNGRFGVNVAPDSIGGVGTAQFSVKNNTSGQFAAGFEGYYGTGFNTIAGTDLSFMYFYYNNNGSPVGRVYTNGSTTTYGTSSDYRLKENIAPMSGGLQKVMLLKPCTYTWKRSGENAEGFIAHELQEVIPEAVAGEKDEVFEDGSIKPQMVDAGSAALIATLVSAIQEQQAIIETLTNRITALEAK